MNGYRVLGCRPSRLACKGALAPQDDELCVPVPLALFTLAQIIVRRADARACRSAEGIELLFRHRGDAAVVAHANDVEALLGVLVHPMLAFQLGNHALDGALHAERLAAADA